MTARTFGIVIILLSTCALLTSLPFLSGYNEKKSILWNLGKMEVVFSEESISWALVDKERPSSTEDMTSLVNFVTEARKEGYSDYEIYSYMKEVVSAKGVRDDEMISYLENKGHIIRTADRNPSVVSVIQSKRYIPFRWFFAFSMLALFSGIGAVLISGKKK